MPARFTASINKIQFDLPDSLLQVGVENKQINEKFENKWTNIKLENKWINNIFEHERIKLNLKINKYFLVFQNKKQDLLKTFSAHQTKSLILKPPTKSRHSTEQILISKHKKLLSI